jgi:hypothetical protein
MTQFRFPSRFSAASQTSSVSEVVHGLVDRLIPDGGKGLLGHSVFCETCEGSGYTRKNQSVWQACPDSSDDWGGADGERSHRDHPAYAHRRIDRCHTL